VEQSLFPVFPLDLVLLPEEPLPLHIFEERYKLMIGECLEAKASQRPGEEFGIVLAKQSGLESVGCSARIVNVTRTYEDGRMDILTVGKRRFEILSSDEEKVYLRCDVNFFEDEHGSELPNEDEAGEAIELFRQALQRLRKATDIPVHFPRPYRNLSFRIAAGLPLEAEFKQELLPVRNEGERIGEVIRLMKFLLTRLEELEISQKKAGGNGDMFRKLS
jgi:ATP-dependent Lon protease